MKTNKKHHSYSARGVQRYPYPNAADRSYFVGKILDGITALVTGMGTITVLFFLVLL